MNYRECMEYIEAISSRGSVLGLDTMRELLRRLDDPQDCLRFIHVAGTNGKGSTSAFLASVLKTAGYRTGVYSSPSVFSYLEKIRINGKNISQKAFASVLTDVRAAAEAMEREGAGMPTVFEVETACAFLYFFREKCDIVIAECGMGGDLDATNVITTTVLSVITSVSLDHMSFLGNTVAEIAAKKAGIIKPSVPVVTVVQDEEAAAVIKQRAEAVSSKLTTADPDRVLIREERFPRTVFDYGEFGGIEINMAGDYQTDNAALAIESLSVLSETYPDLFKVTGAQLKRGMKAAVNPGRLEMICEKPAVVIDGAHNPDAALRLRMSLDRYFKGKKFVFIIGVFADKCYEEVVRIMAPLAEQIITVKTPDNPRALDANELAKTVMRYNENVTAAGSVEEALEMALLFAGKKDIILAFGSLSYLGRLKTAATMMRGRNGR